LPGLLGASGNFEMVVFGILLVLILQFARDGLWPFVLKLLPAPVAESRPAPVG
jgi:ABC-type branched-subunit amino acid transport system permease subunit